MVRHKSYSPSRRVLGCSPELNNSAFADRRRAPDSEACPGSAELRRATRRRAAAVTAFIKADFTERQRRAFLRKRRDPRGAVS
eukprot:5898448-Pyramimonas_sp.AAC.1